MIIDGSPVTRLHGRPPTILSSAIKNLQIRNEIENEIN